MSTDFYRRLAMTRPFMELSAAASARIDLWWLQDCSGVNRLLYGWVIPREGQSASCVQNHRAAVEHNAIISWTMQDSTGQILETVKRLLAGESLNMAGDGAMGDEKIAMFGLPLSELSLGPTICQPILGRASQLLSAPSPLDTSLAYCVALTRPSKASLFRDVEGASRDIVQSLSSLVGLDFARAHATRLGNLEFFAFPSATPDETSAVDVTFQGGYVVVSINAERIPRNARVCVRCCENVRGSVLSDQLRILQREDLEDSVQFPMAADGPWSTDVDIWLAESPEQPAILWASQVAIPLRGFSVASHISGGGVASHDWLRIWSEHSEKRAFDTALRSLRSREEESVKYAKPAWAFASQSAQELTELLSAGSVEDRLFADGLGEDKENLLRMFLKEVAPIGTSDVILVDPDLDESGLTLLSRSERSGAVLHFVTTATADDQERLERLIQAAESGAADRPHLIEVGVVTVSQHRERPSERYLFFLDANQEALRGYQLSRSLNSAEVRRTLLITEISRALLVDIIDFVKKLVRADISVVAPSSHFATVWPRPAPARPVLEGRPTSERLATAIDTLKSESPALEFDRNWERVSGILVRLPNAGALPLRGVEHLDERLGDLLADPVRLGALEMRPRPPSSMSYGLLDILRHSLEIQYHRAWDIIARWHVNPSWWPVLVAVRHLALNSTALLVRAVEENIRAIEGNEPVSRVNISSLEFVSISLHVIIELFAGPYESDLPPVDSLLKSKSRFLRAVGAAAVGKWIVDVAKGVTTETFGPLLNLPSTEQALASSEIVYRLRIRANRSQRNESERDRSVRLLAFDLIRANWQNLPDWRRIVKTADGPSLGVWSVSTTNDLLLPLVEAQTIAIEDVLGLWGGVLSGRWTDAFGGHYQFYADADAPLTQLVASLCLRSWPATSLIEVALRLTNEARQVLNRPFSRSLDYSNWDHARSVRLWVNAWAELLRSEGLLEQVLLEILQDAEQPPDPNEIDPSNLFWFARVVRDQTKKQLAFPAQEALQKLESTVWGVRRQGLDLVDRFIERGLVAPTRVRSRVVELAVDTERGAEERESAIQLLRSRMTVDPLTRKKLLTEWGFDESSTVRVKADHPGQIYGLLTDDPDALDDFVALVRGDARSPIPDAVRDVIIAMRLHLTSDPSRVGSERAATWQAYAHANRHLVRESILQDIDNSIGGR